MCASNWGLFANLADPRQAVEAFAYHDVAFRKARTTIDINAKSDFANLRADADSERQSQRDEENVFHGVLRTEDEFVRVDGDCAR